MPTPPSPFQPVETGADADRFRALIEGVSAVVTLANTLAERGRPVDLDGLNDMVGLLCARALDLPFQTGRAARPMLVDLEVRLSGLEIALRGRENGS